MKCDIEPRPEVAVLFRYLCSHLPEMTDQEEVLGLSHWDIRQLLTTFHLGRQVTGTFNISFTFFTS